MFRKISGRRSRFGDAVMPPLSTAADHSVLWLTIAGGLGAFGGRRGRRAAMRGVFAIAGASIASTGVLKRLLPRRRPGPDVFPFVGLRRQFVSSSMPSGHTASAVAFATAVSMEAPVLAAPIAALAAAVAYSRVYNGAHYPGDVLFGGAIGIGAAVATTKVWPRIDDSPATAATADRATRVQQEGSDGSGLTIVLNPAARSGRGDDPTDALRAGLPNAKVVALDDPADLEGTLRDAAASGRAIGVVGGDGSINTAVAVALEYDCPLMVVPGGTLNHFARDLGLESVEDAVAAVARGQLVAVDVGTIDDRPFVNTASMGSYSKLVEAREHLEETIGKWPALAVALVRVLRDNDPFDVVIDGRSRRIWMIFIGNCAYEPAGFAPATRARLDDGMFDVRVVDGSHRWARVRLIAAALSGSLRQSTVYTRSLVDELKVKTPEPDRLAADGEVFEGRSEFRVTKHPSRLLVYAPDAAAR